ncbi:MAG: hypothetical protein IPJ16_07625 [Bacteroidales bacterium]|nr:hypothetical protein [Bacteroidales bacterium]
MKQLSSLLKISVSLCFIFLSLTASGDDPYRQYAGAGEAGMGYSCVMKRSFWSSFHNQASLAYSKSFSAGFNYENRFGIRELGTSSAGIIVPAGKASIGAIYSHFGYTDFKRDLAGLACGLKLADKLSAGIQVDYFSERTPGEYSNNQFLTCEAGLLLTPSDNISIGIHLFNPVPNSIRKTSVPSILRTGLGTNLSETLFAGIEAEMSTGRNLIIRTGLDYEASKNIWIRGGFCTENNSFSFGLGYLTKIVMIDLGFRTHDKLGVTSSASLIFKIH